MFINSFFKLKFYFLGGSWVKLGHNKSLISSYLFVTIRDIGVFYLLSNEVKLKRIFFILRSVVSRLGLISIVSTYFYLLKDTRNSSFLIRETSLSSYTSGYFSNQFTINSKVLLPDLVLVFNIHNSLLLLKELRSLGVPVIGIVNDELSLFLIEYDLVLNSSSYFINFYILRSYSRFMQLVKHS
jgi:hypothetical protein